MLTPELLAQCPTYMYLRDKVEETVLNVADIEFMNRKNLHHVPLKVVATVNTSRVAPQGGKEMLCVLDDGRNEMDYTSWFIDMVMDGMPFESFINTPTFTWRQPTEDDDIRINVHEYHLDILCELNKTHSLIVVREDILTKIDTNKEALETTKLLEMELD